MGLALLSWKVGWILNKCNPTPQLINPKTKDQRHWDFKRECPVL